MNAASAMLPKPRGPEQTALASQFTEALKHRYAGRLRSAKEILLEIVQKPGDSAWHRKAKTLLMESDSILMQFFNIALGPLFIGGATVGAFEQYQRAAQEKVWMERNARDCEEVKRRRCGGPHKDERDCSVGQAGDPLNCQDVLRRLEFE